MRLARSTDGAAPSALHLAVRCALGDGRAIHPFLTLRGGGHTGDASDGCADESDSARRYLNLAHAHSVFLLSDILARRGDRKGRAQLCGDQFGEAHIAVAK